MALVNLDTRHVNVRIPGIGEEGLSIAKLFLLRASKFWIALMSERIEAYSNTTDVHRDVLSFLSGRQTAASHDGYPSRLIGHLPSSSRILVPLISNVFILLLQIAYKDAT